MPKKSKPQARKTVTIQQAAEMLGVDVRTIFRMLNRGELQGRKRTLAFNSPREVYLDSIEDVDRKRQIPPAQ